VKREIDGMQRVKEVLVDEASAVQEEVGRMGENVDRIWRRSAR
jgi:hypothetical protein